MYGHGQPISRYALLFAVLAGCSQSPGHYSYPASDLGVAAPDAMPDARPDDLSMPSPDLALPPPDLAMQPPDLAKPSGACTNMADYAILMAKANQLQGILFNCAQSNSGQEPATKNCVQTMTGFSNGCTTCFDNGIMCALNNCLMPCLNDPNSQACVQCRMINCDPAFEKCAGVKVP